MNSQAVSGFSGREPTWVWSTPRWTLWIHTVFRSQHLFFLRYLRGFKVVSKPLVRLFSGWGVQRLKTKKYYISFAWVSDRPRGKKTQWIHRRNNAANFAPKTLWIHRVFETQLAKSFRLWIHNVLFPQGSPVKSQTKKHMINSHKGTTSTRIVWTCCEQLRDLLNMLRRPWTIWTNVAKSLKMLRKCKKKHVLHVLVDQK